MQDDADVAVEGRHVRAQVEGAGATTCALNNAGHERPGDCSRWPAETYAPPGAASIERKAETMPHGISRAKRTALLSPRWLS